MDGMSIDDLKSDSGALNPIQFLQKHGDGFLLVFARAGERLRRDQVSTRVDENVTSSIQLRIFAVQSEFDWIDVGRTPNNDISIPDNTISKLHAWFKRESNGRFTLYDAGSRNGTRVDDQRVGERGRAEGILLAGSASIEFGSVRARFVTAEILQDFICTVTQQQRPT